MAGVKGNSSLKYTEGKCSLKYTELNLLELKASSCLEKKKIKLKDLKLSELCSSEGNVLQETFLLKKSSAHFSTQGLWEAKVLLQTELQCFDSDQNHLSMGNAVPF